MEAFFLKTNICSRISYLKWKWAGQIVRRKKVVPLFLAQQKILSAIENDDFLGLDRRFSQCYYKSWRDLYDYLYFCQVNVYGSTWVRSIMQLYIARFNFRTTTCFNRKLHSIKYCAWYMAVYSNYIKALILEGKPQ